MWSAWTLHAWGSTHYSQHTASRNTSVWRALWEAHYLPPRWMKPYRHAEAHGHWRGMQCKSSWKLPFNDGVAWQFWDCQPIMELAPKSKPSINGLTQLVVETFGLFSSSISRNKGEAYFSKCVGLAWAEAVYPRGHRFLISFEEVLLPVSATPAGCCIDLPKEGVDYTRLSRTRVWRAGATS